MGRLVNEKRIIKKLKPENAGNLLVFCEGNTEYNYLNFFKDYLEKRLTVPYSNMVIEPINTSGNAMHVYRYAEDFLNIDVNRRKYALYEKHLVFDCDAPVNIQDVIDLMINSDNEYILDYSNLLFETWLLMHFQRIDILDIVDKRSIINQIRNHLDVLEYNSKVKASKGMIAKILGNDGNAKVRNAIENAKHLEEFWKKEKYKMEHDIKKMNPSVMIYELIERLLDEIDYFCN